jgi:hypothetical protein
VTALADPISRADRARLLGRLAEAPEPVPLHRRRPEAAGVTALTVTPAGSQGGLAAPARAVPGIRPRRGERPPATGADPAGLAGEPLLDLAAQAPDRRLGLAQLGEHPRLDGHLPDEGIEVRGGEAHDGICESLLRGRPGHVTSIAVTSGTTERTTSL